MPIHFVRRVRVLFSISLLAGNIYIYLSLKTEMIDRATRIPLFVVFSIVSAVGLVLFLFIIWRSYVDKHRHRIILIDAPKKSTLEDIRETLKMAGRLLRTRNMLLLLIPFAYSGETSPWTVGIRISDGISLGISQTFFQGVYATCIGHYMKYGGKVIVCTSRREFSCLD